VLTAVPGGPHVAEREAAAGSADPGGGRGDDRNVAIRAMLVPAGRAGCVARWLGPGPTSSEGAYSSDLGRFVHAFRILSVEAAELIVRPELLLPHVVQESARDDGGQAAPTKSAIYPIRDPVKPTLARGTLCLGGRAQQEGSHDRSSDASHDLFRPRRL
jgi:hypothetical protein